MGVFDDVVTPLQNDFLTEDEKSLVERLRSAAENGTGRPPTFSGSEIRGLIAIIDRLANPAA